MVAPCATDFLKESSIDQTFQLCTNLQWNWHTVALEGAKVTLVTLYS